MGLNPWSACYLFWSTVFFGAGKALMDIAEQMEGEDE